MDHLGELYAVGTAICWTSTSVFFARAGRQIGSLVVNLLRLMIAIALLSSAALLTRGMPLPLDASAHAWLWLSVSGIIGFTLGDLCLFRAFVLLGPRLPVLLMSLAPPLTALIGWAVLGETLDALQLTGMSLTLGGICWAVLDKHPRPESSTPDQPGLPRSTLVTGVLLAAGGAAGQAVGLVISKYGMGDYDALAANQIRVFAGTAGFAVLFSVTRWWPKVWAGLRHRTAITYTGLGAIAGPFLGVTLSLLAVQNTSTGVAASIMGTAPILVIPLSVAVFKDKVGLGGVLGAVLAVVGVAILFL